MPYVSTLASQISNGLGAWSSYTYATLSDPEVYQAGAAVAYPLINLTVPINVVRSVTAPDGVGGSLLTNYRYTGLRAEQYTGRGVVGFASMSTTQVQGSNTLTVTTTYSQTWPYTGLVLTTTRSNSAATGPNHQLSVVTNLYACLNPQGGGANTACSVNAGMTYFPYVLQTTEQSWDLNGVALPTLTTTNSNYDNYGNAQTVLTSTGDGYSKTTTSTYSNDTSSWQLGRLVQAQVTNQAPSGALTRTSSFGYDPNSGLLTAETIEPETAQICQTTSYGYDPYGNRISAKTANCSGATGSALFTSRTSTSAYLATAANPVAGQFMTSDKNALNQSESRQYDTRFGSLTSLTGPNGLTTTWTVDAQGRMTAERRADGTQTLTSYSYCNGLNGSTLACPTVGATPAAYFVTVKPVAADGVTPSAVPTVTYFDSLGRPIRALWQSYDGAAVGSAQVYQDTQYDHLGQVVQVSRPYTQGQTAYWSNWTYDAVGRVTLLTAADGATTSTQYDGLTTTVTNAKGQSTVTTKNSQAQIVSVLDANGGTTSYVYDPLGKLVRTLDVAGNVILLTYDLRGHKTQMVDPDSGTTQYVYDALGQLLEQLDASGNKMTMTYDVLGRLTSRSEPDLRSYWTFDNCAMGVGKLCSASTSAGYQQSLGYDNLGRPSTQSTLLDTTYSSSITYDANGRIATRAYPGGVMVQNTYTTLGYLQKVTRTSSGIVLWQANTEDAEGHILTQTGGDGVLTTQTYDPRTGRIAAITAGTGNALQNNSYYYDSLGNLSSRRDATQGIVESFSSDALDRLSVSSVNASATAYSDTYSYDRSGNITSRSDLGNYFYQSVSTPANVTYSCPSGYTQQGSGAGSTCVTTTSIPATPTYTCPAGATLVVADGSHNCASVNHTTTPANITYSCPTGDTLSGTNSA